MECEMPRINSNTQEMKEYFKNTKTIAVIGCSPNPTKDSHRVAKYLQDVGYDMIPIYPKEDIILGQKVYRSLADIEKSVDMVVVFRKAEVVNAVADACIARGDVKVLWTQIGIINNEAGQKAKDAGISVVQNYCAMVEHKVLMN
ncbi:MAG: CoA-binding protein [Epsilonproteobacteria bacterium]|nr:CoA-binding protein [Campylobacterota bacterium]MBD3838773.1 CoA-binding protein [Campylobacterota bacterium]